MAAKVTRLAHKIAIQLHLVAESCTICSSRSRRSVRKHSIIYLFLNFGSDNWASILERDGNFSVQHRVKIGSGSHQASYTMVIGGSFPGGKTTGV
jgi:hypothetical protein